MKPIRILSCGIAVLSSFLLAGAGQAAECSGYSAEVTQVAETVELAKGHSLLVFKAHSIVLTDDPQHKFNLATGECSGTILSTPEGGPRGSGHCLRKDKAGDTYSVEWSLASGAEKGTWKTVAGTGKFAGKVDSGWFQNVAADGKMSVVRWGGMCQ
jgi:hypothetical protein